MPIENMNIFGQIARSAQRLNIRMNGLIKKKKIQKITNKKTNFLFITDFKSFFCFS